MAYVTVHQLNSFNSGLSYVNVAERDGRVELSIHAYERAVYLCREGDHYIKLLVFDSAEWANEYFETHAYAEITKLA